MKCPKCGSQNLEVMCEMTVRFPIEYFHKITKSKIRSKDFIIQGVDYNSSDFICKKCGYVISPISKRFGNVTRGRI